MASDGNYTQGPIPGGGADNHHPSGRPGRILFASLMSFLMFLPLLICCYIGQLSRQNQRRTQRVSNTTAAAAATTTASVSGDGWLSPEVRSSLPIFVYASMALDVKLECAVCLMEFKEGEEGRLLPRCYHSFHTGCVDMWFDSHSTCPLCRSRVESESPC